LHHTNHAGPETEIDTEAEAEAKEEAERDSDVMVGDDDVKRASVVMRETSDSTHFSPV